MLIHRFLAIRFPLKYRAVKTKQNVLITIAVKWLLNFIIVLSVYVPLLKIDLGTCGSVIEYRDSYANESHQVILRVFTPLVLLGIIVLFLLSWRAFGQKSRENGQIHPTLLANLQTITKRRNQVALKTILITVVIFCISYVPVVLRSVHSLGMQGDAKKWLLFVLSLLLFLPNAIDPFIYFARVANFRSAIKQLYQRSASNIHPYTALYSPIQPYTTLYCPIQPYTTLYSPIQPNIALYSPIQPYAALYYPIRHYTALYSPIQPYISARMPCLSLSSASLRVGMGV